MSLPTRSRFSVHRFVALLAALLVPLSAVLVAAPAHADPTSVSGGIVSSANGTGLAGVTVQVLDAASDVEVDSTTTDSFGAYFLDLDEGQYLLRFSKSGFFPQYYGGGGGDVVSVDGAGVVTVGGSVVDEGDLGSTTLVSTSAHAVSATVTNADDDPLAGIEVELYAVSDAENPVGNTTTDALGGFQLGVFDGEYFATFSDPDGQYLPRSFGDSEDPIVVAGSSVALGQIEMTAVPPAAEFPIAGRVLDVFGEGVNGVTVTVTGVNGSTDSGSGSTAGTADEAGSYSVSVLPGTYEVSFAKSGFSPRNYAVDGDSATITVSGTGVLSVSPAETLTGNKLNDFTLPTSLYSKDGSVKSGGVGLEGISVAAFAEGDEDGSAVATATTNGSGGYTLMLRAGTYTVRATDNNADGTTYDTTWLGGATHAVVRIEVDGAMKVNGVGVSGLPDITMSLSSADTPHPVFGGVADVNGDPIDGLKVTAVPLPGTDADQEVTDTTGADGVLGDHGRYRLLLKPGSYRIDVEGGADWADASYTGEGETPVTVTVALNGTVTPSADLGSIQLTGTATYPVPGVVETAGGSGLVGITLSAYAEGEEDGAPVDTATSTSGGAYTLDLPVGTYTVRASDGVDDGTTYDTTWLGGSTHSLVRVAQGGSFKVDGADATALPDIAMALSSADTPHPVTGAVADVNGDPIDGLSVTAVPISGTDADQEATDTTGADGVLGDNGRFRLLLKPGSYRIDVEGGDIWTDASYTGDGDTPVTVVVALNGTITPAADLGTIELLSNTAYPVTGTVKAAGGSGLTGITLRVYKEGAEDGAPYTGAISTAGGAYSLDLPVGTYTVRAVDLVDDGTTYDATWLGGNDTHSIVRVAQGGSFKVDGVDQTALPDIAMPLSSADTPHPVTGAVADANGDAIDGLTVTAVPLDPTPGDQQATDTTGADGGLGDHGRYRLLLKPGTYRIDIEGGSDFADASYTGEGATPVTVTVALDGTITPAADLGTTTLTGTHKYDLSGTVKNNAVPAVALAGITVQAFPGGLDADPATVLTATTNASGAYTFTGSTGLVLGSYVLQFTDNNSIDGVQHDQTWFGSTTSPGHTITVAQSGILDNDVSIGAGHDLGTTTMAPGTGPYAVTGQLADVNGDPIVGATVTATKQPDGPDTTATTDAEGNYSISLAVGTYKIRFTKTDFTATDYTGEGETAATVEVQAGGTATVNGVTAPGRAIGATTMPGSHRYDLSGTVRNGSTNLSGITVQAFPGGLDAEPASVLTATTNASGVYTFTGSTGLVLGSYVLQFTDNNAGDGTQYDQTWFGSTASPGHTITVAQSGILDNDVSIGAGHDLGVTQMVPGTGPYAVTGQLADVNGDPIVGATVTATRQPSGPDTTATTDAEGNYSISLAVGTYKIRFTKTGFTTTDYTGDAETAATVEVLAGGTATVNGVSAPGRAIGATTMPGSQKYDLSGTVRNGSTNLSGITVQAFPGGLDAEPGSVLTATTNASGVYTFTGSTGLVLGSYVLQFTDSNGVAPQYDRTWFGSTTSPGHTITVAQSGILDNDVSIGAGHDLGITQMVEGTGPYAVTGQLADVNGEAIAGATVTATKQPSGPGTTATTDAEGNYSISLAVGTYKIMFTKADFAPTDYTGEGETAATIEVVAGGTIMVNSVEASGGDIGGTTMVGTHNFPLAGSVSHGGSPVSGITVEVFSVDDTTVVLATDTTDASGTYEFTGAGTSATTSHGLPIGTYKLRFTDNVANADTYVQTWFGGTTAGTAHEVKVGQNGTIYDGEDALVGHTLGAVVLEKVTGETTFDVYGEVGDVNGDPVDGITVTALPVSPTPGANQVSRTSGADGDLGDNGRYRLPLKAGTYNLRFSGTGWTTGFYLDPEAETPTNAVLTVASNGTIKIGTTTMPDGLDAFQIVAATSATQALAGRVTKAGGVGLAGITVRAIPDSGAATRTATSGADGSFTLNLVVDTYKIQYVDLVSDATTYISTFYDGTPDGGATGSLVKVASAGGFSIDEETITALDDLEMTEAEADAEYPVKGTVSDPNFEPLDGVTVKATAVSPTPSANTRTATTGVDPDEDAPLGEAGVYKLLLKPGKYKLTYTKTGYEPTALQTFDDPPAQITLTVGLDGQLSLSSPDWDLTDGVLGDVSMLFAAATFKTQPKLTGKVVVGQVVTASLGTLNGVAVDRDSSFVEWFIDGKLAELETVDDIGQKARIPATAATKKLSFRVTISDPEGLRASSVFTSKPVAVPKAPATVKGTFKKGKLTVMVTVPTLGKPLGTITVKEGKKVIGTAKLTAKSNGKVVLKLKLKKGKHTLTLSYSGNATVNKATGTVKLKA